MDKTTKKIMKYRGKTYTDEELAEKIGISKPTFYTRLKFNNWKKSEVYLINKIKL
jgi:hypothetical protein